MSTFNRRSFFRLGAGGAAALALGKSASGTVRALMPPTDSVTGAFFLEPSIVNRLAITGDRLGVAESAIVAFAPDDAALVEHASPTPEELRTWAAAALNGTGVGARGSLDDILRVRPSGGVDVGDLISNAAFALAQGRGTDAILNFFHGKEQDSLRREISMRGDFAVLPPFLGLPALAPGAPLDRESPNLVEKFSINQAIFAFGWQIRLHGPESADYLGKCVKQPVTHFNLVISRQNSRGGWTELLNFHIGIYKRGRQRCFVIWQNKQPYVYCLDTCNWTRGDFQNLLTWGILAAAALAGVAVAYWLASTVAAVAATVLWPLLLLV